MTSPSVAAELSERDWSVIVRTNCLLSGQRLTIKEKEKTRNHSVERTPFNGKLHLLASPSATAFSPVLCDCDECSNAEALVMLRLSFQRHSLGESIECLRDCRLLNFPLKEHLELHL